MYTVAMKLCFGTANRGKLIEMREGLDGLPIEVCSPAELGITESPEEHGSTFEDNALAKARFYCSLTSIPTLADDSGIMVEALQSELGIHTRRWGAGKDATDAEWIAHFLARMERERNRRARFVCVLAYIDAEGREHLFEGDCEGEITHELEATYLPGLPISACFKPFGSDLVYSALSIDEKNRISHRGRALKKFADYLQTTLG